MAIKFKQETKKGLYLRYNEMTVIDGKAGLVEKSDFFVDLEKAEVGTWVNVGTKKTPHNIFIIESSPCERKIYMVADDFYKLALERDEDETNEEFAERLAEHFKSVARKLIED